MTQRQLCDRAKISMDTIRLIENDKAHNLEMKTLKKIAHALDCLVYVNIKVHQRSQNSPKSKPNHISREFPLEYPEAPPLPLRKAKVSGKALWRAVLNVHSYQKNYRRRKYAEQHKVTSGKRDLGIPEDAKDE
jgi:transcriptional regulator with XRE-family HTH domain